MSVPSKDRVALLAVAIVLTGGAWQTVSAQSSTAATKPNVVFILVDNVGWGDFSAYGGTVPTPRIDSIAKDGLRFNNYTVEAQCTPTRSAILTGQTPVRSGTMKVPLPGEATLVWRRGSIRWPSSSLTRATPPPPSASGIWVRCQADCQPTRALMSGSGSRTRPMKPAILPISSSASWVIPSRSGGKV